MICSLLAGILAIVGGILFLPAAPAQAQPSDGSVTAAQASAAAASNVRLLGQIGGSNSAFYVDGRRAYIGTGVRLTIVDISVPDRPVVLGVTPAQPRPVIDVMVVADVAYVTDGLGMRTIDVSNPANPSQLGYYETPHYASEIFVAGNRAFIADSRNGGLDIVDVSTPSNPKELGFYDAHSTYGMSTVAVFVVDRMAYIVNYDFYMESGQLQIVDVGNPSNPTALGYMWTALNVADIYVVGTTIYVAQYYSRSGPGGLRIIDASNPATLRQVSNYPVSDSLSGVFVTGATVYLADWRSNTLYIVDASNLANPRELGRYSLPEIGANIFVFGTTAYVTNTGGLHVLDVSNPASTRELGFYKTFNNVASTFVVGTTAYVVDPTSGLRIFNVSDPAHPTALALFGIPGRAAQIFVTGARAYVAASSGDLHIIDVNDPANPRELGSVAGRINYVFVVGTTAYLSEEGRMRIVDVSVPTAPRELGVYDAPGSVDGIFVVGTTAYIADGTGGGLRIVDVRNAASPTELGFYQFAGDARRVFVSGWTAYMTDGSNAGLRIINVGNPARPQELGSYKIQGYASDVFVVGNLAYVASDTGGLRVLDVSNPASPQELGFYETPTSSGAIFVADRIAYLSTGSNGLFMLGYPPCYRLGLSHTGAGANPIVTSPDSASCRRGEYLFGEPITLRASPDATWRVAGWVGTSNDNTTASVNQLSMPAADHEVTVNYAPTCYKLALTHNGTGSDPVAAPPNSPGCAPAQYMAGTSISLQASPSTGYTVSGWTGALSSAAVLTNSLTMPGQDNYVVSVTYVPACYSLTLAHNGSGSDPAPSPAQSGGCSLGYYHFGEPVSLSAAPSSGWQIVAWSGTTNNTLTTTVNSLIMPPADHTVEVHYGEVPVPGADGDTFELDDNCSRSRLILADGVAQQHTFHAAGDADWIRFDATAGLVYRIEAHVPQGSLADVVLEVYRDCDSASTDKWTGAFSPDARLDIKRSLSEPVYVRISNVQASVFGSAVRYEVSVRKLDGAPSARALILVAGRLKSADDVQDNIHRVAQNVYRLFQRNGYSDDNIYFLATDPGQPGFDAAATKANLQQAIIQWAAQRVANGVLNLYLVDHGGPEVFYLDNVSGQVLSPGELNDWLTQLESAAPNVKINVIIEACESGSFIDQPTTLSKPGRVIVTSTSALQDAKASNDGAYFSDHLLTWLQQGYNLFASFYEARTAAKTAYQLQDAWLDANGNGTPNELEDSALAAQRSFAYANSLPGDSWPPYIFAAQALATGGDVQNGQTRIRIDVRDDHAVAQVRAVVYAPSYTPPPSRSELQPEVLPTFLFAQVDSDNHWEAQLTGLTETGTYRVVIYATDDSGLEARPFVLTIPVGTAHLYLPVVTR